MRVTALVRTLNEHLNIERFCRSYTWADKIIVADGGSEDDTLELAARFKNVAAFVFTDQIKGEDGKSWRNPHGKHINALIRAGIEDGADWLIFDDCDCIPNFALREGARQLMEPGPDSIYAYRYYIGPGAVYWPDLNKPGQSLWAWRPAVCNILFDESNPWGTIFSSQCGILRLEPPLVLLHHCWPTEEEIQRKNTFYKATGEIKGVLHPKKFAGTPSSLPDYAHE